MLLQGGYLGNKEKSRRFRLASRDVGDPSRYGDDVKFVKIVTSTGARLRQEPGAYYEATVAKQVNSPENYVCLNQQSPRPLQLPCGNYPENEVIPTFILCPDNAGDSDEYSDRFVQISPALGR